MHDISLLPPAVDYQYFSHLFHSNKLISRADFVFDLQYKYPDNDLRRLKRLFLQDLSYIQNCRILDLGCHIGFFSYVAAYLGAQSIHGVNARQFPLEVAKYACSELNVTNFKFEQHNIEDLNFLESVCADKDTVILTLVLEHLKNPYAFLETISKSKVQNIIFESSIIDDTSPAALKYYFQSTESAFTVYDDDENKKMSVGACPNLYWIEEMFYWFGWKIETHHVYHEFNANHFATPKLEKFPPKTLKKMTLLAKKFNSKKTLKNYQALQLKNSFEY